jgi:ketohexokinase
MGHVLVVGNAALDIINTVAEYPPEDSELRASAQRIARGGNGANTAAVLAGLGHDCAFAGQLADDDPAALIQTDLQGCGVDLAWSATASGGRTPTSYITLSAATGSRSIVHHRDLPELSAEALARIPARGWDWVHLEGRNVEALGGLLERVRSEAPETPISLEVEKPRPGIEVLAQRADWVLYSAAYARALGHASASALIDTLPRGRAVQVCTWGAEGAWGRSPQGTLLHAEAPAVEAIVESVGAGDSFNAGLIDAALDGADLQTTLRRACALGAEKLRAVGFDHLRRAVEA